MKRTVIVVIVLAGAMVISTQAQELVQAGRAIGGDVGIVAVDPIDVGRVVLDAPYTAEAVTEMTQTLADGNRIEQRTSATIARDSRGRTRREQQGLAFGAFVAKNQQPMVSITDPESGVHITLNYDLKVAFRAMPFKTKVGAVKIAPDGATEHFEARLAPPPVLERMLEPPDIIAAPPIRVMSFREDAGSVEQLEASEIEGIKVEGFRRTTTIATGAIGNVMPIQIVSERWYSPELQVVVMSRRHDPRFGETVYRLTNIQRGEPSPDLFKIPADFRIEEMRPGRMAPVRPDGK